jgi:hypothetical protein
MDLSGRTLKGFTRRIESKEVLSGVFPNATGVYFLEIRAEKHVAAWRLLIPK